MSNRSLLRRVFDRALESDRDWTVAKYAEELASIATTKGWNKGFSAENVWKLINDPASVNHRRIHRHEAVARIFAEKFSISIDDILRDFDTTRGDGDAANYQTGIWQFIMLAHAKRKSVERTPSVEVRRTLVKFDNVSAGLESAKRVSQLGVTTAWVGEYRIRSNEFTFIRFFENKENQEMTLILERPTRRIKGIPSYQRGICLGVAFGPYDHPRGPIVSGRCVLRRLELLSDEIRKNPDRWNDELKSDFCGYVLPANLRKRDISIDKFNKLLEIIRERKQAEQEANEKKETISENK